MKKIITGILFLSISIFAQEELRNAIDEGDLSVAKKMVKAGEIEEIYCGKLSPTDAVNAYETIFKKAPEASFEQCKSQFAYGYGEKICASKASDICESVFEFIENEAVSGNANALKALPSILKVALSNKLLKKPVKEKVDTLLWQPCNKKRSQECLEKCVSYADSTGDSSRLEICRKTPEELVEKTITVTKPSAFYASRKESLLNGFWKSPFAISGEFAKIIESYAKQLSIEDSLVPGEKFIANWAKSHKENGTVISGGELFRLCSTWQPFVDSLLTENELNIKCPEFIKYEDPRDGQEYKLKAIAGNDWFVENLNYATEFSECYDEDEANCKAFGRLYTQAAAITACPEGFHLSTDDDWYTITDAAGGSAVAAEKLRVNGTDDFAFSALFGGYINKNGIPATLGEGAYFWTNEVENKRGVARSMFNTDAEVSRITVDPGFKLSVRCVRMHVMTVEEMAKAKHAE